jgi:hypothetical protein
MAPCKDCAAFDLRKLDLKEGTRLLYKASFADLESSVEDCPLCRLFQDQIVKGREVLDRDDAVTIKAINNDPFDNELNGIYMQCRGREALLFVYFEEGWCSCFSLLLMSFLFTSKVRI